MWSRLAPYAVVIRLADGIQRGWDLLVVMIEAGGSRRSYDENWKKAAMIRSSRNTAGAGMWRKSRARTTAKIAATIMQAPSATPIVRVGRKISKTAVRSSKIAVIRHHHHGNL